MRSLLRHLYELAQQLGLISFVKTRSKGQHKNKKFATP